MGKIAFDVGDDSTVVVSGVFVSLCIESSGAESLRLAHIGDPRSWTEVMLLQAALDRAKSALNSSWSDAE